MVNLESRRTSVAIIISLLIHISLPLLFLMKDESDFSLNRKSDPILVEIIEKSPSDQVKQQIVRDFETPKEIQKDIQNNTDPAMFLSSRAQRVQKQTRASIIGPNRNSFQPRPLSPRSNKNPRNEKVDPTAKAQLGPGEFNFSSPVMPIESTVGTLLPNEIEIGSFTALNTDKFTYYSFFERIEDKIRFRWENEVRKALSRISSQEIARYPKNIAISNLEIILSRDGEVEKIFLTRSSGLRPLDEAPAQAFWEAKNFMNPPQGLLEANNKIHLRYQFLVYLK